MSTGMRFVSQALIPFVCLLMIHCSEKREKNESLPVPELSEITTEQADELITYLRKAKTQTSGSAERPMAWAMINWECETRALTQEYFILSASFPLSAEPAVMHEENITEEAVQALVENPGIDAATINIVGPLALEFHFINPDGTLVSGDPFKIVWGYHKGVVVNIEGELKVIDLSSGDTPLNIDDWAHHLVDESVACYHMSNKEYSDVWVYWNSVMGGYEVPERPERICGYTITPVFTFRWDQTPLIDQLKWAPSIMQTQSDGFKNYMNTSYGITVSDNDESFYTGIYTSHDETWICEEFNLPYCTGGSNSFEP